MAPKAPKKRAHEMNDEELLARVFPKKAREHMKKLAHSEKPKRQTKSS
jgi:hypothetical protein